MIYFCIQSIKISLSLVVNNKDAPDVLQKFVYKKLAQHFFTLVNGNVFVRHNLIKNGLI